MDSSQPVMTENRSKISHGQVGGHNPFIYMKDGRV